MTTTANIQQGLAAGLVCLTLLASAPSRAACDTIDDLPLGQPEVIECMNLNGYKKFTVYQILDQETLPAGLWAGRAEADMEFELENCQITETLTVSGKLRGVIKRFDFAVNENTCANVFRADDLPLAGTIGGTMKGTFQFRTAAGTFSSPVTVNASMSEKTAYPLSNVTMIDPVSRQEVSYTSWANDDFNDWIVTLSGDSSSWLQAYNSRLKRAYPDFFKGSPQYGNYAGIDYVYYPDTGNFVGLSERNVIIYGPYSGMQMQTVGKLPDITQEIERRDALWRAEQCKSRKEYCG